MKIFKIILRILILTHLIPGILMLSPHDTMWENYCTGWAINALFIGIFATIGGLIWVFTDDDKDYDYF